VLIDTPAARATIAIVTVVAVSSAEAALFPVGDLRLSFIEAESNFLLAELYIPSAIILDNRHRERWPSRPSQRTGDQRSFATAFSTAALRFPARSSVGDDLESMLGQ
jgi:hypothetical protein